MILTLLSAIYSNISAFTGANTVLNNEIRAGYLLTLINTLITVLAQLKALVFVRIYAGSCKLCMFITNRCNYLLYNVQNSRF